jgi:hypothetical protein
MSATITAFPRAAGTHGILSADVVRRSADRPRPGAVRPAAVRPAAIRPSAVRQQTAFHQPAHLHITRRGRAVVTVAVILAAIATVIGFVLSGGGAVATSTSGDVHFDHVTVAAGETLWQVAVDVAPSADPRDVITDIQQLNNLDSTQVLPGQSLAIPAKYSQK